MLLKAIAQVEERTARLIEELENERRTRIQYETENTGLREAAAEQDAVRARVAELEGWHDGVCRHRDELQAELDRALERVRTLEEEKTRLCAERDDLQLRFQEAAADGSAPAPGGTEKVLAGVSAERDELRERVAGFERQKAQMRTRLTSLIDRIECVERALEQTELIHEHA